MRLTFPSDSIEAGVLLDIVPGNAKGKYRGLEAMVQCVVLLEELCRGTKSQAGRVQ